MADLPDLLEGIDEPDALTAAAEAVRGWCHWHIAPSITETVTLDGNGTHLQPLSTRHLTAVTTVVENGKTLVEGTDYDWSQDGLLWRHQRSCTCRGGWTNRFRGITATITHGYAVCPTEIAGVIARLAKAASTELVAQETAGPYAVAYRDIDIATDPYAQFVLAKYTIPVN